VGPNGRAEKGGREEGTQPREGKPETNEYGGLTGMGSERQNRWWEKVGKEKAPVAVGVPPTCIGRRWCGAEPGNGGGGGVAGGRKENPQWCKRGQAGRYIG